MPTRIPVLLLIVICSVGCSPGVDRSIDLSADRLAEIRSTPYVGGNGPGGFATARLAGYEDETETAAIEFTGFGPYLHAMGFRQGMTIRSVNGVPVLEIFTARWNQLRLEDAAAYDAEHYRDLIEYLFAGDAGNILDLEVWSEGYRLAMAAGVEGAEPVDGIWRIRLSDP